MNPGNSTHHYPRLPDVTFGTRVLFESFVQGYSIRLSSCKSPIGPFLLVMSLFGTTMTAFALVGSTGQAYRTGIGVYGMLASSSGIIHSLCFFLIGVKVWTYAQKNGYTTQIEFFRDRLDSDLIGLLLFPILVGLVIPYLLIGVISSGGVIQAMTAGLAPDWAWFQSFRQTAQSILQHMAAFRLGLVPF